MEKRKLKQKSKKITFEFSQSFTAKSYFFLDSGLTYLKKKTHYDKGLFTLQVIYRFIGWKIDHEESDWLYGNMNSKSGSNPFPIALVLENQMITF